MGRTVPPTPLGVHRSLSMRAFRISFSDPFLQMLEAKYWEDPPVDGELVWEQPNPRGSPVGYKKSLLFVWLNLFVR